MLKRSFVLIYYKILAVNEPTSAMDLAELYIEVLMRGHIPVSPEVLDKFQQVGLPARLVDIVYQRHF